VSLFEQVLDNIQLMLLMAVLAFGIISFIDWKFFEKKRHAAVKLAHPNFANLTKKQKKEALKGPYLADLARELFGVLLIVFLIRSFIGEPFRIPSGSLLPTLKIGDWIVVTRYDYQISTPIWSYPLIKTGEVHRGDIIVFHFPVDPSVDLIKRVIGVPGDSIDYINKQLYINGHPASLKWVKSTLLPEDSSTQKVEEYEENLLGVKHFILQSPWLSSPNFYHLIVPKGEYFVMGDNRGDSEDSRYWGFVPADNIVGKARFIFWSWDDHYHPRFSRIGKVIH